MPTAQTILEKKGTEVTTVAHDTVVREAARLMNKSKIGALVVTRGDNVVGIFTERDILTRVVAAGKRSDDTRVEEAMTAPMACCRRDTKLEECRAVMTGKRIRHLPVVEDGKLYGLISSGDILAHEVEGQQATIEYLHEYLYGRR
ncbi:MAG: CBS domain-containing protein [Phycisphaerae bacterium]|jgi:CBS domain-containing protein